MKKALVVTFGLALLGAVTAGSASAATVGNPAGVGAIASAPIEEAQYIGGYAGPPRPGFRPGYGYGRPYYGGRRYYGGPRRFYGGPRYYGRGYDRPRRFYRY